MAQPVWLSAVLSHAVVRRRRDYGSDQLGTEDAIDDSSSGRLVVVITALRREGVIYDPALQTCIFDSDWRPRPSRHAPATTGGGNAREQCEARAAQAQADLSEILRECV